MFVLFDEQCNHKCHDETESKFPFYVRLDSHNALVYASYKELTAFATQHNTIFRDFAPLMPEIRLDASVYSMCQGSEAARIAGRRGESMRLRVNLPVLDVDELTRFHHALNRLRLTPLDEAVALSTSADAHTSGSGIRTSHSGAEKRYLFEYAEARLQPAAMHPRAGGTLVLTLLDPQAARTKADAEPLYESSERCAVVVEAVAVLLSLMPEVSRRRYSLCVQI